jgi:hypothetical protein
MGGASTKGNLGALMRTILSFAHACTGYACACACVALGCEVGKVSKGDDVHAYLHTSLNPTTPPPLSLSVLTKKMQSRRP